MRIVDSILWRRLDLPGHDYAALMTTPDGSVLSGTANFLHSRKSCSLRYEVVCDPAWRTKSVRVSGAIGRKPVEIEIVVSANRAWTLNGSAQPQVEGCVDVDLAFTPATNLLPIRRLELKTGQLAAVTAAWLVFPALRLQELPQTYRRLANDKYAYTSFNERFRATLSVRKSGLVEIYPKLWRQQSAA